MQKPRDRGACGAFRRARRFQFFEPIASPKTLVGSGRKKAPRGEPDGAGGDAERLQNYLYANFMADDLDVGVLSKKVMAARQWCSGA